MTTTEFSQFHLHKILQIQWKLRDPMELSANKTILQIITNYKEIKKSAIISPLFLDSKSDDYYRETDLKQIQTFILSIICKIANDAQINNTSLPLFESI
ncbi:MAG: hypothetical protein V8R61_07200 [Enterocloster sp.]